MMILIFIFLFLLLISATCSADRCQAANFRNIVVTGDEDYLIYGVTPDCQMFFARPSQIHLLSRIRINPQYLFCSSSLVQFHLKTHDSLILTFKQAHNRICTLVVHIPNFDMIFGDHLFRYSLLNSLPYAACSHTSDRSFSLEPDLSFMDPVYRDVIYFVDSLSRGSKWRVFQFALNETGTLSMMNNLTMRNSNFNENVESSDFLLTIDNRRDKLFRRNKLEDVVDFQCGYEMLFKPEIATVKKFKTLTKYGNIVNGQSIEEDIMIYVEADRTSSSNSHLKVLNIDQPGDIFCLVSTSFSFDVGILRQSSLDYLRNNPFPRFGTKIRGKSKQTTTMAPKIKAVKTAAKQVANKISTTTPESTIKSNEAYSPSKSFFSFETTAGSLIEENGDEISDENEINEIVRELSTDDDGFRDGNLTRRTLADNETIVGADAVKNVEKLFVSHVFSLVILIRLACF